VRRLPVLVAAAALALVSVNSGSAQTLGPSVNISIVDAPRPQSKWGYAPTSRTVPVGSWVTWSNNGQDTHSVTAIDGSFDSGDLDPSDGFSWYFDTPGTYQYTCVEHSWMTGTIVVADGSTGQP
jgi:plastocyanin